MIVLAVAGHHVDSRTGPVHRWRDCISDEHHRVTVDDNGHPGGGVAPCDGWMRANDDWTHAHAER